MWCRSLYPINNRVLACWMMLLYQVVYLLCKYIADALPGVRVVGYYQYRELHFYL